MSILDENDNVLQWEDIDLEKGYLKEDAIFVRHHDAIIPDYEHGQYIEADAWDEYEEIYRYILYTPEELVENARKKAEQERQDYFIKNGLFLIEQSQADIEDMILLLAEMLGTENTESSDE